MDGWTDVQSDRQSGRRSFKQFYIPADEQIAIQADKLTNTQRQVNEWMDGQMDSQTHSHINSQTGNQTDSQTGNQTGNQTDSQTDSPTVTQTVI
jgi:hypothetical protein